MPLGAFGLLGDSFSQTPGARWTSSLLYLLAVFYFVVTPRNKNILATDMGILVPRIVFPPYKDRWLAWEDIYDLSVKYDRNGNGTLILHTRSGKAKIRSLFCFDQFEVALLPTSYIELYDYIAERVHEYR